LTSPDFEEVAMTRLTRTARTSLSGDAAALFDQIAGGERAGQKPRFPRVGEDDALEGPFNAMLLSPRLGMAMQQLGGQVRYQSTLTDRCREIAILTVAARWNSAYESYAHEDIGRAVGLTDDEICALAAGRLIEGVDEIEATVAATAQTLAHHADLDDAQYAVAVGVLGERRLFELVVLVGYYAQVALQLRVFRVQPPAATVGSDS
jgi:4-carboxymuconolactone decarboxylase